MEKLVFEYYGATYADIFNFQGLFKKDLNIQVLSSLCES